MACVLYALRRAPRFPLKTSYCGTGTVTSAGVGRLQNLRTMQSLSVAGQIKTSGRKSLPSDSCSEAYGSFSSIPNWQASPSQTQLARTLGSRGRGDERWMGRGNERQLFAPWEGVGGWESAKKLPDLIKLNFFLSCSKHYPSYSLNVASMWLKLGRLHMALENRPAGVKALKRVFISWFLH